MAGKKTQSEISLGLYKGCEYYGRISDKLTEKLDKDTLEKFLNALRKGFVKRDHGDNGVKFISDVVVEIKIRSGKRLYAVKKNELLIFDRCGNHKSVKRFKRLRS